MVEQHLLLPCLLYTSLLWWTGVHGGSICGGILSPILQANMAANQKIIDSGLPLTIQNGGHIFTQQFWDNFLCMSGAGIVIGLVIYITFFAKSKSLRSLGKLSIVPNIFNINEPIIFGTPIVLNIYLLIPFVLVPLIIGISSYLLMYMGILPLFSGVMAVSYTHLTEHLVDGTHYVLATDEEFEKWTKK